MGYVILGLTALALCILIAPVFIFFKSLGFIENVPWVVALAPLWMPLVCLGVVAIFAILAFIAFFFVVILILLLSAIIV